jgi:hypothetical protein
MKMRQFLVFPYPDEAGPTPWWAAGATRDGKDEKTVPTEAVGCILAGDREVKMEILVKSPSRKYPFGQTEIPQPSWRSKGCPLS